MLERESRQLCATAMLRAIESPRPMPPALTISEDGWPVCKAVFARLLLRKADDSPAVFFVWQQVVSFWLC
jgi:hypothetical protein